MPISNQTGPMKKDKKDMDTTDQHGKSRTMKATTLTPAQARRWMLDHWDADEIGTDLDIDMLEDAYLAIFERFPADEDDAFGDLKRHLSA